MPNELFEKMKTEDLIHDVEESKFTSNKLASVEAVRVQYQGRVHIHIGLYKFTETFIVMPKMNSVILRNSFFVTNDIEITPAIGILRLPDFTLQLNNIHVNDKYKKRITPENNFLLLNGKKITVNPQQQKIIECLIDTDIDDIRNVHGLVHPYPRFEQKTGLCVKSFVHPKPL